MAFKINWKRLINVKESLSVSFKPDDILNINIVTIDAKIIKIPVKFQDLLTFFWTKLDSKQKVIAAVIIMDSNFKILYEHRHFANCEKKPLEGNADLITNWKTFSKQKKTSLLNTLIKEINE